MNDSSVKHIQMLVLLISTIVALLKYRFFEAWKEWAQKRAQLRRDSQEFSNQRIQSWVNMELLQYIFMIIIITWYS